MSTFLEGVDAVRLPCTLAILVPGVAVVLTAGRRAAVAFGSFLFGATVVAWARFSDNWFASPRQLTLVVAGLTLGCAIAAIWRLGPTRTEVIGPAGTAIGAIVAWLWRPCVGRELGSIIDNAPADPAAEILPTFAYLLGATLLALAVVAAPHAWPRLAAVRDHRSTRGSGALLGVLLGLGIAIGTHDDLVAELLRRSSV